MAFEPLSHPLDHIVLAGRRSPGLATIEGVDTPREFQERRGFGVSFANLRFRGCALAHFKVLLRLYSKDDWADWHAWRELVARPTAEAPPSHRAGNELSGFIPRLHAPPMDIEHPILADFEITSVVVENVLQPVQTADGEWTIEIHFGEYREPVMALETTRGSRSVVEENMQRQIDAGDRTIAFLQSPAGLAGL